MPFLEEKHNNGFILHLILFERSSSKLNEANDEQDPQYLFLNMLLLLDFITYICHTKSVWYLTTDFINQEVSCIIYLFQYFLYGILFAFLSKWRDILMLSGKYDVICHKVDKEMQKCNAYWMLIWQPIILTRIQKFWKLFINAIQDGFKIFNVFLKN